MESFFYTSSLDSLITDCINSFSSHSCTVVLLPNYTAAQKVSAADALDLGDRITILHAECLNRSCLHLWQSVELHIVS